MRKRSKIYRRKVSGYAIEPPERLLSLLNDASVSHKQRHAIAKKLLPYFHEKPKPLRPEELDDSLLENHPRENEDPGSASDERERLRKMIFDRFDRGQRIGWWTLFSSSWQQNHGAESKGPSKTNPPLSAAIAIV